MLSPTDFSGHGASAVRASADMPTAILVQVSNDKGYRSNCVGLIVLPCPRVFLQCVSECFAVSRLLLGLSGDIELNPGPDKETMAMQDVLKKQTEIANDIKELKTDNLNVNKTLKNIEDRLSGVLSTVTENGNKIRELESEVELLKNTIVHQHGRLVEFEDRSRRNNLIVFGIHEEPGETRNSLEEKVLDDMFNKQLGVSLTSVERIHRIGRITQGKNRPVVLRVFNYNEKVSVFKNCKKLKGTAVSISDDFSKETLQTRKKLWESAHDEKRGGAKVKLVNDRLYVDDVAYVWDYEKERRVRL
ncbi:unnamed protein product, partial [Ixodes persulcatus]